MIEDHGEDYWGASLSIPKDRELAYPDKLQP